jgi:hypothetical protein
MLPRPRLLHCWPAFATDAILRSASARTHSHPKRKPPTSTQPLTPAPAQARAFADTERLLKGIMAKTRDKPNALQAGSSPGA